MKIDWKEIWDANPGVFIGSGWEECSEDKKKVWHLSSRFSFYSSGDMNLRLGIIACQGNYKDEEFLLEGIIWGSRLGNGARTVIYYVAQDFSPVFLRAAAMLGGTLTAKAVYWREKLNPSLYPVREKIFSKTAYDIEGGELIAGWDYWEREMNPVALNHLITIKNYFEGLKKRRVRTVFQKNKIVFCWGKIEIAEVKKKSNKFELSTKVRWTRNKNIASKFLKSGWVDCSGMINEEFCRAVNGILELLENMESNGSLDARDLLAIKLINDKEFVPAFFGKHFEFPLVFKEKNDNLELKNLYYFFDYCQINVVNPVLERPMAKIVNTLLLAAILETINIQDKGLPGYPEKKWNQKIYLLSQPVYRDELRLCQSWLKDAEQFPIILLPEDWKTEGLNSLRNSCTIP